MCPYWVVLLLSVPVHGAIYRVGVVADSEGAYMARDGTVLETLEMWGQSCNSTGLLIGGVNYNVIVDHETAHGEKSAWSTNINASVYAMTLRGANLIVCPFSSGRTKHCVSAAKHFGLPVLSTVGSADSLYTTGYKYLYSGAPRSTQLAHSFGELMIAKGAKTAAILTKDSIFEKSAASAFRTFFNESGIELVYDSALIPADFAGRVELADVNGAYSDIKELGTSPDVIIFCGTGDDFITAAAGVRLAQLSPKALFFAGLLPTPPTEQQASVAAWWYFTTTLTRQNNFGSSAWRFGTTEEYIATVNASGLVFSESGARAMNGILVYERGMQDAGSLDLDLVHDAIMAIDSETFFGHTKIYEGGYNGGKDYVVLQYQETDVVQVALSDTNPNNLALPHYAEPWPWDAVPVEEQTTVVEKKGISAGALAGIIVASLVVFGLIVGVAAFMSQKRTVVIKTAGAHEIDLKELTFGKQLGIGSYGEVCTGTWRGTDVAIKTLLTESLTPEANNEFASEVEIMCQLRHPNVLLLMGACTKPPKLCMVLELMAMGSLHTLLHDESIVLANERWMRMVFDVSQGMVFLHSANPQILHRDLKSLNLLVDGNLTCKVSDFGLTSVKTEEVSGVPAFSPFWAAPEIINNKDYTDKADVFSFAIVLWEVVTRDDPYAGENAHAVMLKVSQSMYRPTIPDDVPQQLKEVMQSCWAQDPNERPSMVEASKQLKASVDMNSSYATRKSSSLDGGWTFGTDIHSAQEKLLLRTIAPTGTVTLVNVNLPSSDMLWAAAPSDMPEVLQMIQDFVRQEVLNHNGYEAFTDGECSLLAFDDAFKAAECCVAVQKGLLRLKWPEAILATDRGDPFRGPLLGMAVHTGTMQSRQSGTSRRVAYMGAEAKKAKSMLSAATDGQILVSVDTKNLIHQQIDALDHGELVDRGVLSTSNVPCFQLIPGEFKPFFLEHTVDLGPKTLQLVDGYFKNLAYTDISFEGRIGVGSFGELFEAFILGQKYAVKRLLRRDLRDKQRWMFKSEIASMIALRHPNVTRLRGFTDGEGEAMTLVFDLYEGDLTSVGSLTDKEMDVIFLDVAKGINYIHTLPQPLVHRDLKPGNILIKEKRASIADFGLARVRNANQTMTKCGTVAYSSPQVLKGELYGLAADVFSFGVILNELLSGVTPWKGKNAVTVSKLVIEGSRAPIPPTVPQGYRELIEDCCKPEEKDRPTMKEVLSRLEGGLR